MRPLTGGIPKKCKRFHLPGLSVAMIESIPALVSLCIGEKVPSTQVVSPTAPECTPGILSAWLDLSQKPTSRQVWSRCINCGSRSKSRRCSAGPQCLTAGVPSHSFQASESFYKTTPKPWKTAGFLERAMVEKNGESTPRLTWMCRAFHLCPHLGPGKHQLGGHRWVHLFGGCQFGGSVQGKPKEHQAYVFCVHHFEDRNEERK